MSDAALEADVAAEQDVRAKSRLGATLAGKYRLESVLGAGGMATVYAATHRNGKEVALKLLHPELGQNTDIRRRFLREGYVANHVKHPGAVSVLDDDVTDEGAFLVMERLEGMTLDALWETRVQVNPACVAAVLVPLLDVMQAAHEKGIVHRDLKPANIFLTRAGEVKVLDFGIARMRDATSAADTMQGEVMGTPSFMAPEQAMGQSKAIDAQTDLWAIGAIGFALVVGEVVHPAENGQQAMVFAATRHARSVEALAPTVPSGLAKVLDRALAFDKKNRWESAPEMRAALVAAACEAYGELPGASVIRVAMGLPPHTLTPAEERGSHPTMDPDSLADLGSSGRPILPALVETRSPRLRGRTETTGGIATGAVVIPPETTRARLWLAAAMATASVVAISTGVLLHGAKSASAPAIPSSTALAVAASEILPPTGPEITEVSMSVAPEPPAPSSTPQVSSAPATPPKVKPSRVATAPSAAKAVPRCSQFVIDPQTGVKRWRLECL